MADGDDRTAMERYVDRNDDISFSEEQQEQIEATEGVDDPRADSDDDNSSSGSSGSSEPSFSPGPGDRSQPGPSGSSDSGGGSDNTGGGANEASGSTSPSSGGSSGGSSEPSDATPSSDRPTPDELNQAGGGSEGDTGKSEPDSDTQTRGSSSGGSGSNSPESDSGGSSGDGGSSSDEPDPSDPQNDGSSRRADAVDDSGQSSSDDEDIFDRAATVQRNEFGFANEQVRERVGDDQEVGQEIVDAVDEQRDADVGQEDLEIQDGEVTFSEQFREEQRQQRQEQQRQREEAGEELRNSLGQQGQRQEERARRDRVDDAAAKLESDLEAQFGEDLERGDDFRVEQDGDQVRAELTDEFREQQAREQLEARAGDEFSLDDITAEERPSGPSEGPDSDVFSVATGEIEGATGADAPGDGSVVNQARQDTAPRDERDELFGSSSGVERQLRSASKTFSEDVVEPASDIGGRAAGSTVGGVLSVGSDAEAARTAIRAQRQAPRIADELAEDLREADSQQEGQQATRQAVDDLVDTGTGDRQRQRAGEGLTRGAGAVANLPGLAVQGIEAGETAADVGSRVNTTPQQLQFVAQQVVDPPEDGEDLASDTVDAAVGTERAETVADRTVVNAAQTAEAAKENPAQAGGQVTGSIVAGAALSGAASVGAARGLSRADIDIDTTGLRTSDQDVSETVSGTSRRATDLPDDRPTGLDAADVDDATGTTGPSVRDRVRGFVEREITGDQTTAEDIPVYREERASSQLGVVRDRGGGDSSPSQIEDFDGGGGPPRDPNPGEFDLELSQRRLDRASRREVEADETIQQQADVRQRGVNRDRGRIEPERDAISQRRDAASGDSGDLGGAFGRVRQAQRQNVLADDSVRAGLGAGAGARAVSEVTGQDAATLQEQATESEVRAAADGVGATGLEPDQTAGIDTFEGLGSDIGLGLDDDIATTPGSDDRIATPTEIGGDDDQVPMGDTTGSTADPDSSGTTITDPSDPAGTFTFPQPTTTVPDSRDIESEEDSNDPSNQLPEGLSEDDVFDTGFADARDFGR